MQPMAGQLTNLQILRFIAAALVVFTHAVDLSARGVGPSFLSDDVNWKFGALGVDVFFVVSGFIIARSGLMLPSADWRGFLSKRLIRVVPIYFVLSLPWIALRIRDGAPWEAWPATFLFWPAAGSQIAEPVLVVGWTLCFEMLFYLGATVVIAAPNRYVAGIALLAVYAVAWVARTIWPVPVLQFLGNPVILEFLLGVLVAYGARWITKSVAVVCGAVALVWFGVAINSDIGAMLSSKAVLVGDVSLAKTVILGLPSMLLLISAIGLEAGRARGLMTRAMAYLGDASYATYLIHLTVFMALAKAMQFVPLRVDMVIILGTVFGIAAGAAVYQWVERPLLALLKGTVLPAATLR